MSFEMYRCPACGMKSSAFDGAPFACRNDTCAEDAAAASAPRELRITREALMREAAVVYYLALGNRIKIGTTTDLPGRMAAVPHEELVAFEFGSYKLERQRHDQFAHARIVGEWFDRADEELTAWVTHLQEGLEDPTDVARSATRAVKRRILGLEGA